MYVLLLLSSKAPFLKKIKALHKLSNTKYIHAHKLYNSKNKNYITLCKEVIKSYTSPNPNSLPRSLLNFKIDLIK